MRFDEVPHALLERCVQGTPGAADELFTCIQADLYAFIISILRRHDDASDVLQECLLRVYRHIHGLDDISRFPWWLMRIAVNLCNTHLARQSARGMESLDEKFTLAEDQLVASASRPVEPARALESKRMQQDIHKAIRLLPEKQRSAILLFEVEGLQIKEIARLLECSEGAIKFNIHEARKKLRETLKDYLPSRTSREESRT